MLFSGVRGVASISWALPKNILPINFGSRYSRKWWLANLEALKQVTADVAVQTTVNFKLQLIRMHCIYWQSFICCDLHVFSLIYVCWTMIKWGWLDNDLGKLYNRICNIYMLVTRNLTSWRDGWYSLRCLDYFEFEFIKSDRLLDLYLFVVFVSVPRKKRDTVFEKLGPFPCTL